MNSFDLIIKPDEDDPEGAEVLAEVQVDGAFGTQTYPFLLDTGAGRTSMLLDAYTATFAASDQHSSSGVFAQHIEDVITVPRIALGPIVRTDFPIVRVAENAHGRNLIGMDLLRAYRCHFLFDEKRVLVGDEAGSPETVHTLQMDRKAHPYVPVMFGDAQAPAVWDTGASITVVSTDWIATHPAFFTEAGYAIGTDSTGAQMKTAMYIMAETVIGHHIFAPHRVAAVDLSFVNATIEMPMTLILGYSTLRQANWWFDFPNQRWAITRQLTPRVTAG
ncbi:MAG: hypothetical protein OHK0046_41070 [Anaerolineae bacterium]